VTGLAIDTSAVVAVVLNEPGASNVIEALDAADRRVMGTPTLVELGLVLAAKLGPTAAAVIERFLRDAEIDVVDFDREMAERATEGWMRFGKGRHPAGLNFGDTMTFGVAVTLGLPILCTGNDFAQTDVKVVPSQ
jgi:ribonuclease VapC